MTYDDAYADALYLYENGRPAEARLSIAEALAAAARAERAAAKTGRPLPILRARQQVQHAERLAALIGA